MQDDEDLQKTDLNSYFFNDNILPKDLITIPIQKLSINCLAFELLPSSLLHAKFYDKCFFPQKSLEKIIGINSQANLAYGSLTIQHKTQELMFFIRIIIFFQQISYIYAIIS